MAKLSSDGTTWTLSSLGETWTATSSKTFPQDLPWGVSSPSGLTAPVIGFQNCAWVEDGEFRDITFEDLQNHTSGTGMLYIQWKKAGSDDICHAWAAPQYGLEKEMTVAEEEKMKRYCEQYTDTCGAGMAALRDSSGDLLTDSDGYLLYAAG